MTDIPDVADRFSGAIDEVALGKGDYVAGGAKGMPFLSFENLYTFTKYSGNDPSIGGGIDNNLYPTSRKASLGVTLTF